jgi:hypothetical protein
MFDFKTYLSHLIKIESDVTNFVLHNKTLTEALEWIVNKLSILTDTDTLLQEQIDNLTADTELKIKESIKNIQFDTMDDVEIVYDDESDSFQVTRIVDDLIFESSTQKLSFTVEHNLGLIPIIQIFTRTATNRPFMYTLTDFFIDESTLTVTFTEASFCKIIFKS